MTIVSFVLACASAVPSQEARQSAAEAEELAGTLVRGVLHRAATIATVSGEVIVHWVKAESYARHRALSQGGTSPGPGSGPGTPVGGGGADAESGSEEPPTTGTYEATWFGFGCEPAARKWQLQTRALVNNGDVDVPSLVRRGARTGPIPPALLYQCVICNGTVEYRYDRGANAGVVYPFEGPEPHHLHYRNLYASVILGVSTPWLDDLRAGRYVARYEGRVEDQDFGECHLVLLTRQVADTTSVGRLRIAPDYGFVVVEHENAYMRGGDDGQLLSARHWRCAGLEKSAEGLWCANRVQIDDFSPGVGPGPDSPKCSRVYEVLRLRVNEPVQIASPFQLPFPFDAPVTDFSAPQLVLPRPAPPLPPHPPAITPMAWAPNTFLESVRARDR